MSNNITKNIRNKTVNNKYVKVRLRILMGMRLHIQIRKMNRVIINKLINNNIWMVL